MFSAMDEFLKLGFFSLSNLSILILQSTLKMTFKTIHYDYNNLVIFKITKTCFRKKFRAISFLPKNYFKNPPLTPSTGVREHELG